MSIMSPFQFVNSDAALRERLFTAFQAEALVLVRQKALSREDCSALVSSFARIATSECAALRDAARAEVLAFVVERLSTREEIAVHLYADPAFTERWEETAQCQWQGAHDNAKAFFLTKADALLRALRGRLGVKP